MKFKAEFGSHSRVKGVNFATEGVNFWTESTVKKIMIEINQSLRLSKKERKKKHRKSRFFLKGLYMNCVLLVIESGATKQKPDL